MQPIDCSRKDNATNQNYTAADKKHNENDHDQMVLWKMALTAISIFILHVFESIAHFFAERVKVTLTIMPVNDTTMRRNWFI